MSALTLGWEEFIQHKLVVPRTSPTSTRSPTPRIKRFHPAYPTPSGLIPLQIIITIISLRLSLNGNNHDQ